MERIREFELLKILVENTDEDHKITKNEILSLMEEKSVPISDDTLSKYLKQFNDYGYDVRPNMGRNASYRLRNRIFKKEEVILLADAVNASNFIEKDVANSIKKKLKLFLSKYQLQDIQRSVRSVTVAKTENKKIMRNVEIIQKSINENKCISFDYLTYDENLKLVKKSDKRYTLSPLTALWAYDRYYLYGCDTEEKDGAYTERNYRVDKLDNIKILPQERVGTDQFKKFNCSQYVSRRIGMFSGEEDMVTVKIDKKLIGAFVDQFGKTIKVEKLVDDPDKLIISFVAVTSDLFLGWILGLENVEIISPTCVRERMVELIEKNIEKYKK